MKLGLLIFLLGIYYTTAQSDLYVYATPYAGTEVINLVKPNLAYASNLVYDPQASATNATFPTLWFTADKSSPNIHKAQFDPKGGDHSFWASGQSPFGSQAAPYIATDVVGELIIGVAFPNNWTGVPSLVVQSANAKTGSVSQPTYSTGYTFISVAIDRTVSATNQSYVYLGGWGPSGFVVARGLVSLTGDNSVFIDPDKDIRAIDSLPCYDLYDSVSKPKLYITSTYLILAVSGRCAAVYKFSLPDVNSHWNTVTVQSYVPPDLNLKYMSSSVFDSDHGILYYIMQLYNEKGGHIFSLNTTSFLPKTGTTPLDIAESLAILVLGNEETAGKKYKYIFVACSGSYKIERFTVNEDFTLSSLSTAVIDPSINTISSALYIRPYFYYTTYEPDAKIIRISKSNFCGEWCGVNGYCDLGKCVCKDGYEVDVTDPTRPCRLKEIVDDKVKVRQSQGASAALGVLFVFSLLAAIAGWFLWWKARQNAYKSVA